MDLYILPAGAAEPAVVQHRAGYCTRSAGLGYFDLWSWKAESASTAVSVDTGHFSSFHAAPELWRLWAAPGCACPVMDY